MPLNAPLSCLSRPFLLSAQELNDYKAAAQEYSMDTDPGVMNACKTQYLRSVATEISGLAVIHLTGLKDKAKLRAALQGTIKHMRGMLSETQNADEEKESPLRHLHMVLQRQITNAMQLR